MCKRKQWVPQSEYTLFPNGSFLSGISGSCGIGGGWEDDCLLGCCVV
jgi:hypothetical protein